jgi:hypothetical protein
MQFMRHPDLDAHIEAAPRQVPVFEKSGWKAIGLTDLPKTELLAEAKRRGAPTRKSAPKAEIAEAITSVQPEEG